MDKHNEIIKSIKNVEKREINATFGKILVSVQMILLTALVIFAVVKAL